jgi:amidophosphoribosyltransferase
LVYQDLDDLIAACTISEDKAHDFDTSCFTGEYCTGDVTEEYLQKLELQRNDAAKNGDDDDDPEDVDSMDIHNED